MEPAYIALTLYILWTLLWLIVGGTLRFYNLAKGNVIENLNPPLADNVPPVLARVVRVHGNALENLPLFAAVVLLAGVTGNIALINPLAYIFIAARAGQSIAQVISNALPWPYIRGAFFLTQVGILIYWAISLLVLLAA